MPEFGNYDPASFGWVYANGAVPFTYQAVDFPSGVANPDVAAIFTEALNRIVPRMSDALGAHTDCWGYEPRNVRGSTTDKSFHGYGLAVDVNAVSNGQTTQAMTAATTTLPLDTGARVRDLGIEWGGDWSATSPRDPMHLELHLTPAEATALAATLRAAPVPVPPVPVPVNSLEDVMAMYDSKAAYEAMLHSMIQNTVHAVLASDSDVGAARFGPNFKAGVAAGVEQSLTVKALELQVAALTTAVAALTPPPPPTPTS